MTIAQVPQALLSVPSSTSHVDTPAHHPVRQENHAAAPPEGAHGAHADHGHAGGPGHSQADSFHHGAHLGKVATEVGELTAEGIKSAAKGVPSVLKPLVALKGAVPAVAATLGEVGAAAKAASTVSEVLTGTPRATPPHVEVAADWRQMAEAMKRYPTMQTGSPTPGAGGGARVTLGEGLRVNERLANVAVQAEHLAHEVGHRAHTAANVLQKVGTGLAFAGGAFDGVSQLHSSTNTSMAGRIVDGTAAGLTTAAMYANPVTGLAILGDTLVGTHATAKVQQHLKGAYHFTSGLAEAAVTGGTEGVEKLHEQSMAGQHGPVLQAASQAGQNLADTITEGGVKQAAKDIWSYWTGNGILGGIAQIWK